MVERIPMLSVCVDRRGIVLRDGCGVAFFGSRKRERRNESES
jgi:hypothetical protein